jgi:cell division protein FtsW
MTDRRVGSPRGTTIGRPPARRSGQSGRGLVGGDADLRRSQRSGRGSVGGDADLRRSGSVARSGRQSVARAGSEGAGRTVTRRPSATQPARPIAGRAKTGAGSKPARRQGAERRWPGGFLVLLLLVAVLNLIGLVMILSASSVESLRQYGSPWYYFERQLLWLSLGSAAFGIAVNLDYRRWRHLGAIGVIGSLGLLMAVMVPGLGISVSGSSRWLGVGSWRLQPSELAKLALVIFAADLLDRRAARVREWRYSMVPVLLVFGLMGGLVMLQPDMGTTMVLACTVLAVLYAAGAPLVPMSGILGMGGVMSLGMAVAAPYRWRRMTSFVNPFADASNTGYQSAQGLVALGSGRLAGLGIGASRASWGYLPNQQTDFIFAIIGEETGLIGSLLIVGLFVTFAVLGVRAACRAPDRFGALLAAGITAWIVGQAIINIGAVVGLVPVTGVPLPFVSFGGSSLIIALGAVGILGNIAKQSR